VPSTSGSTGTSPSSGSMQTPVTTSPLPDPCDSSPSKNKKSCR
jgi:hypothetical protein